MGYKTYTSQTTVNLKEQGDFIENQLRLSVPPWNIGFYVRTFSCGLFLYIDFQNLIFMLFAYIWIFMEGFVSLLVYLAQKNAYS